MSLAAAMQMDILDPIQHNSISPIWRGTFCINAMDLQSLTCFIQ